MEFGWLRVGVVDFLGQVTLGLNHHGMEPVLALAALVALALVLAAGTNVWRHHRRRIAQTEAASIRDEAARLKDRLRQRLYEPAALFANGLNTAPTMGACEAFEGDLEAVARTVLVEAGGHRAKARQLLRQRMNGEGADKAQRNGSEVNYWRQLGALSLLDGIADAPAAYARAADLAPENAEAQMLAGVLHLRAGNLASAEAAFRRQIELGNQGNGSADAGLARYRGQTMLGDVLAAREDPDAAIAAYTNAQHEVKALLERSADNVTLQRDLSVTYDRIGDAFAAKGEVDAALECYRRSLEIAQRLAQRDHKNAVWQHDLSVSFDRIGDLLDRKGDGEGALESFRKSLAIAGALSQRDPNNVQWQWDLSASHDRVGDALIAQGRLEQALDSYRRGLMVAEALAARDPAHPGWQRDLAVSYHKIGSLEAIRNPAEARELLERGRAIIDRLAQIAAHKAQWRSDLSRFDEVLRTLDQ
jgi:tetratricopeptide (TPR) repeat protein